MTQRDVWCLGFDFAGGGVRSAATSWRSLLLLGACASSLLGCEVEAGSGVIVSETRRVSSVSKVSVCCDFDVDFKIGSKPKLVLEADDNLIDNIEVEVKGGELAIEWDDDLMMYDPSQRVHLELTLPTLHSFAASGGARLKADDISGEQLHIDLSGGSEARFSQVWTDELAVELSGGSKVMFDLLSAKTTRLESSGGSSFEASGLSTYLRASVSGGGHLHAADLIADHVQLDLSGGSQAEVTATETLEGDASGGSTVHLHGTPSKNMDLSGGSEIKTQH